MAAFLAPREAYATGLSYRVLDGSGRLRERGPRGAVFLYEEDGSLMLAVLFSPNGTAFPLLGGRFDPGGPEAIESLARLRAEPLVRGYRPSGCIGAAEHALALERALGWQPDLAIAYDAMRLEPEAGSGRSEVREGRSGADLAWRRATRDDLEGLMPLALAYEREEVVTALHRLDPAATRAAQERSLASQLVYVAERRGRIVARAQTNARGVANDQIGGVYVEPAQRGLGLGRLVVGALVADILGRGRGATLFVKRSNETARGLYLSLGFSLEREYRIAYFA